MTDAELRRRRALAQGLHRPAGAGVHDVVRGLLAVQGQDLRSARRAVRARSHGTTAADVDRLLDERGLVVTWVNRGTLHLMTPEDYPWLLGLTGQASVKANARRLRQEGVDEAAAERGVRAVVDALSAHGPLTRDGLRAHVEAADVAVAGQALIHVLMATGLRGLTVRGPVTSAAGQAYALTRDWLGIEPPQPLEGEARDRALAELARRYLAGHGPATDADLGAWAGLPLRDVRRGLSLIPVEELSGGLLALAGGAPPDGKLPPRLLGSFDPYLIGWKRRDLVVDVRHQPEHFTKNGILSACAIDRGRAVAAWRTARDGSLELEPYDGETLSESTRKALHRDAEDLRRFETRATPRT